MLATMREEPFSILVNQLDTGKKFIDMMKFIIE